MRVWCSQAAQPSRGPLPAVSLRRSRCYAEFTAVPAQVRSAIGGGLAHKSRCAPPREEIESHEPKYLRAGANVAPALVAVPCRITHPHLGPVRAPQESSGVTRRPLVSDDSRQPLCVPDPGADLLLGRHLIDQVLPEIDCAHRHEELGGIALREFDDRVDSGLLEQVGILPADALDAIKV